MTKILLDFDGVQNVFNWKYHDKFDDLEEFFANGYSINWSPSIAERLYNLPAEISILSTWQSDFNEHIAPVFGWDELPVISNATEREMHPFNNKFEWWKLIYAQTAFNSDGKIIWIDDDIKYYPEALEWIDSIEPGRILAISPDYGLTHEHLDTIEEWLEVPF